MIFISFSSPCTKTIILLLHSVKALEPYGTQSAHDQEHVKLKMDSVEGCLLNLYYWLHLADITIFRFYTSFISVNVPLLLGSEVSLVLFLLFLYNSLHVATSYMCLEAIKIPGLLNNMSQSIARSHS